MNASTKKAILIGIIAAAGTLLVGAGIWFFIFTSQFAPYSHAKDSYEIKYPKKWQAIVPTQGGASIVFLSPKETALDTFQENVTIAVEPVPGHLASLDNFTKKVIEQMTKVFGNIKVTESKAITFAGRRGWQVEFSTETPDAMKVLAVWTIKGGEKAYIFTFVAMTKRYKANLPLVESMIQSFKIK